MYTIALILSYFWETLPVAPAVRFEYGVRCNDVGQYVTATHFSISARERYSRVCQVVAYGRLKTIENFKQSSLNVVAYKTWSLMRGSIRPTRIFIYSDLT